MAGDTEDLVLSISADVRQMQRALDRLVKDTDRSTKAVQQQFDTMGTRTAGAFDKVAANSNRTATAVQNDARRMATAMQASRFQTANLAAQLNDIGVQLASGTSPFQIALQQGTQINQILGQGGVRGAVSLLGASFASLVNPVSLATIAIIGLGGAAVQYFTSLLSDGQKSEETLKKQADLIRNVAKEWGDALPALRDYVDELDRAQKAADRNEAVQLRQTEIFAKFREQLPDLTAGLADVILSLQEMGDQSGAAEQLRDAFGNLVEKVNDNKASADDFKAVQEALAAVLSNSAVPAAAEMADVINSLAAAFNAAAEASARLAQQNALVDLQKNLPTLGTVPPVYSGGGSFIDEQGVLNQRADATKSQTQLAAEKAARGANKVSDADREAASVKKLVDELEFEYSLLGKTDTERKIATELRKAGAAATDDQRARIEELVTAIDAEQAAMKASEEAMKAVQDIGKDFLGGFIKDILAGKDASEALSNALGRVADKLLDLALNSLFSGGLFGKRGGLFGGIIIPGILHDGGVAGQDGYGHGRAVSPSVFKGARRYHSGGVAGLQPGEVPAILQRGEVVLPRGTRGAGGAEVVRVVLQDDSGRMADIADQQIRTRSGTIVQVSVQQSLKATRQQMPGMIANAQARQM